MAAPKHLQGLLGREVFRFPAGICFFSAGNQGLGVTGEGGSHIDRWEGIKGIRPPWRGLSGEIQAGCNAAFFRLCIPMQAAGASPFPPRRGKLVGLPVKARLLLHEPLIFQVFAFCKVQWLTSLPTCGFVLPVRLRPAPYGIASIGENTVLRSIPKLPGIDRAQTIGETCAAPYSRVPAIRPLPGNPPQSRDSGRLGTRRRALQMKAVPGPGEPLA